MPRRNLERWSLVLVALAALCFAVSGAAASGAPSTSLRAQGEHRLLSLIARARADASRRNGIGVDAALSQFVSQVGVLHGAGQLSDAAAASLDQLALATETQAAARLRPREAPSAAAAEVSNTAISPPSPRTTTVPPTTPAPSPRTTTVPATMPAPSPRMTTVPATMPANSTPTTPAVVPAGPPHGRAVGKPHPDGGTQPAIDAPGAVGGPGNSGRGHGNSSRGHGGGGHGRRLRPERRG